MRNAICGTLGTGPSGGCHPCPSETVVSIVVGEAMIRWNRSPLVVNLDNLDSVRVGSVEACGARKL